MHRVRTEEGEKTEKLGQEVFPVSPVKEDCLDQEDRPALVANLVSLE